MKKNNRGFSLVEMSIVLIIFGLVLASAASVLTLFVNKGGAERTRKMMESNKNTLYSIAAGTGYFINVNGTGSEIISHAELLGRLTYPQDAYGVDFHLITDPTLDKFDNGTEDKTAMDYSPICGTNGTDMTVSICNDAACSSPATVTDAAFVLVSGSVNKNIQTALDTATDTVTVYVQGDDAVDDYTADLGGAARPEKYDDIVDWVTLPELRSKAGCDPLKLDLIDTAVPAVQNDVPYSYTVFAKGGIPYSNSSPEASYYWEILSDESLSVPGGIEYIVHGVLTDTPITSGNTGVVGEYLHISGTPTGMTAGDIYRVKIEVSDDSSAVGGAGSNTLSRTLYIQVQE